MMAEQNMQEFIEVLSSKGSSYRVAAAHVHMWRQQVWHLAQWLPI